MNARQVLLLCLITATVTASVTKFYFPSMQTKTVETAKEVIHNDIQTVIKTVTQPSGETTSTTTIIDHTKRVESDQKTPISLLRKDWLVSASYSTSIHTLEPIYGVEVNRRILGPVYLGALLNNKGDVGLSIGMEF